MRFMMIVKGDKNSEAGAPPRLSLDTRGLLPTAAGARLKLGGPRLTVTDGPFVETKEVIGGADFTSDCI